MVSFGLPGIEGRWGNLFHLGNALGTGRWEIELSILESNLRIASPKECRQMKFQYDGSYN